MKDKFEFDALPQEIQKEPARFLSTCDLVNLTSTSKKYWTLFKPLFADCLLYEVVHGDYDRVNTMLKNNINLILTSGFVKDCSGRAFTKISGFEYALWARDEHMWKTMLACIPIDETGKKILAALYTQYVKVKTEGLTYLLNGQRITEKHFDFEGTIIRELQTQINSRRARALTMNWDAIDKQWREGVGGAQRKLPMHVVYEYCSMLFEPAQRFISPPEKTSEQFYNDVTKDHERWFSKTFKLGVAFAIGWGKAVVAPERSGFTLVAIRLDLDRIARLFKVRTKAFINLESRFKKLLTVDNQVQVRPI